MRHRPQPVREIVLTDIAGNPYDRCLVEPGSALWADLTGARGTETKNSGADARKPRLVAVIQASNFKDTTTLLVVPLTSEKEQEIQPDWVPIGCEEASSALPKDCYAMCSQVRPLSVAPGARRFRGTLNSVLSEKALDRILEGVAKQFGF